MNEVIAEVIPLGVAVAASPFPIVPAVLLLFTARPRAAGLSFLAGWVLGILAGSVAFVLLAAVIERFDEPPTWASWTRLIVGGALLVLGVRQWLTRHRVTESPAWMRSIGERTPGGAARLGLLLSVANPKVLLLAAAAGLAIGVAELGAGAATTAVAVFTLVAASTVAIPVLSYLVLGERVLAPLGVVRTWLEANSAAVMAVVITAIGALLMVKGLSGL